MKHDPNTRVVQRPPQDDVVYKQRVNRNKSPLRKKNSPLC